MTTAVVADSQQHHVKPGLAGPEVVDMCAGGAHPVCAAPDSGSHGGMFRDTASPHATWSIRGPGPPAGPPQNTDVCSRSGRMRTTGKRVLLQCPVWPGRVAMVGVFIKGQPQVPLAGGQHPVQLAADAGDPAFRDRVRAGCLDRRLGDPGCREHGVKTCRELGVPVPPGPRSCR